MAAGNTCVADLVDIVHHEIDSMVRSHRAYKPVWSPVLGEQVILDKEPAGGSV